MNDYEITKQNNELICSHLSWTMVFAPGSDKLKIWKDPLEVSRLIMRNDFDRNFGLLMEALEKISAKYLFTFQISYNCCQIKLQDEIIIEENNTTHLSVYYCLINFLNKCR